VTKICLLFVTVLTSSPALAKCRDLLFAPGDFISTHLGRQENFSGPNCFNTVLRATGVFPESELRYVHTSEFESILKHQFTPITGKPESGDLVLYHPEFERDHVAIWVGNGKVFHKKDVGSTYSYRIVGENRVFAADPGDVIDPMGDPGGAHRPSETGPLKKAFYRRKKDKPLPKSPDPEWHAITEWIDSFSNDVIRISSERKIGERWGYVTEELISDLVRHWAPRTKGNDLGARLALEKLESLNQQVFKNIEDAYFSSRYSSGRSEKIITEICWQDTADFRALISGLTQTLRGPNLPKLSPGQLATKTEGVIQRLKAKPRHPCKLSLLAELL